MINLRWERPGSDCSHSCRKCVYESLATGRIEDKREGGREERVAEGSIPFSKLRLMRENISDWGEERGRSEGEDSSISTPTKR
jgi:hypothetical protein